MCPAGASTPYKVLRIKGRNSLPHSGTIDYRAEVYYIFCYLHCHHFSHQAKADSLLNVVQFGTQNEGWCGSRYHGS